MILSNDPDLTMWRSEDGGESWIEVPVADRIKSDLSTLEFVGEIDGVRWYSVRWNRPD